MGALVPERALVQYINMTPQQRGRHSETSDTGDFSELGQ